MQNISDKSLLLCYSFALIIFRHRYICRFNLNLLAGVGNADGER